MAWLTGNSIFFEFGTSTIAEGSAVVIEDQLQGMYDPEPAHTSKNAKSC